MSTSTPFAYNTGSAIAGTIQVGSLAVGTPTSGFTNSPIFWNGPDEDLGYVIAYPVSGGTHPTSLFSGAPSGQMSCSTIYKGPNINLSNNNQTAFQQFGYQMSVLANTFINNNDKVMFSVLSTSLEPLTLPQSRFIGVGKTTMNYQGSPYGGYPGNDTQSIGFNAIGEYYYNGGVVQSGLPTWTQGDIIDIAIFHGQGWFIRVNGGDWNNNPSADPTTLAGYLPMNGLTDFYPALCPGYEGTMTIQNTATYEVPSGYTLLGTNINASIGFLGTKNMSNPLSEATFVELTNSSFNQNFVNGADASTWLTNNGFWNSYIAPVLYLDAGNVASYPGTGTTWTDLVGGKVFTLNNGPTWVGDLGSIAFTGTNQYISTPVNSAPSTDSATYEMWFYQTNNSPTTQGLLQTRTSTSAGDGIDVSIISGQIVITTSGVVLLNAGSVSVNTWYHLAVVRNGTTAWTVYLNGASIGTFNFTNTTGTELSLGRKSATGFNEFFKGYITNFRYVKGVAVYTTTFTPSTNSLTSIQVSNINGSPSAAITGTQTQLLLNTFTNNFLKDSSSYNLTMSNPNGATSVTNSPFTVEGYFNFIAGSSQYAECSTSLTSLPEFTTSVWQNWSGVNTGEFPCILTEVYTGGSINYVMGKLQGGVAQSGYFNGGFQISPQFTLSANTWYNIVTTCDSSQVVKVYLNNVLISTTSTTGAQPSSSNSGIILMRRWDFAEFWGGNLATVGIYDKSLTQSQISSIYNATKSRYGL